MLVGLEQREWKIICGGLLAFVACVVFGTIVVEIQLNQLTFWQDFVQVFNFRQVAAGAYLAYLLGGEYYLQAAWQVGSISNTSHYLQLRVLDFSLNLPYKVEIDPAPAIIQIKIVWKQGIEAAFHLKQLFSRLWLDLEPYWRSLLQYV